MIIFAPIRNSTLLGTFCYFLYIIEQGLCKRNDAIYYYCIGPIVIQFLISDNNENNVDGIDLLLNTMNTRGKEERKREGGRPNDKFEFI